MYQGVEFSPAVYREDNDGKISVVNAQTGRPLFKINRRTRQIEHRHRQDWTRVSIDDLLAVLTNQCGLVLCPPCPESGESSSLSTPT